MLRVIHTGRAYEVMDDGGHPDLLEVLAEVRNKYVALRLRFWQQGAELEEACREVGDLETLLRNTQLELLVAKVELESCQKSTLTQSRR